MITDWLSCVKSITPQSPSPAAPDHPSCEQAACHRSACHNRTTVSRCWQDRIMLTRVDQGLLITANTRLRAATGTKMIAHHLRLLRHAPESQSLFFW
jgi:hypothetical protein